jgi:hypothetical protein
MRAWKLALTVLAFGCSSTGTQTSPVEAGLDATTGDATEEGGLDGGDDGEAGDAGVLPCTPLVAAQLAPSEDCVFAGPCPEDCTLGTASAYACVLTAPMADAAPSPEYPSVFTAPIGIVNVVASETSAYPWDASAFVSCGPLACVRWATADHIGGTSAWPGDPCADGGMATLAWSCPTSPGVVPPVAGCFATGALGEIGGPGTGAPAQNVWCCPGPADAGMTAVDGSSTESGIVEAGLADATSDAPGD